MKRAWLLFVLMGLTAALSAAFMPRPHELALSRASTPLEQLFPSQFGDWRLDPGASALIRPAFEQARRFQMYDQVLERTYLNSSGQSVMLSVAYGRQQSVGLQMHRPEVCYKAGGFEVSELQPGSLRPLGHELPIMRLMASMEGRPEPITYWRTLGDEVVSDERQFKLRQLSMGISGRIPDGMLVRVSSIDTDRHRAYQLHATFVDALAQALDSAQRRRVLGHP